MKDNKWRKQMTIMMVRVVRVKGGNLSCGIIKLFVLN